MIIEVTQADIDAGVRDVSSLLGGRAASCPVALAMRRCVNAACSRLAGLMLTARGIPYRKQYASSS